MSCQTCDRYTPGIPAPECSDCGAPDYPQRIPLKHPALQEFAHQSDIINRIRLAREYAAQRIDVGDVFNLDMLTLRDMMDELLEVMK